MEIKCWRNIQNCLLFLFIGFLMLSNPFTGRAQNNSAINLSGTRWDINPIAISTADLDNSVTALTGYLIFRKQDIVEALIVRQKSPGIESEYVTEWVDESYIDGVTGRLEYRKVPRQVRKSVPTPSKGYAEAWKGSYEVKGKTVYLDFPTCTIEVNISSGSLKGVVTYKKSKEKQSWILSKPETTQNDSNVEGNYKVLNNNPVLQARCENLKNDADPVLQARCVNLKSAGSLRESNKYSAPVDSPIIGTWKYQDGCTTKNVYGITSTSCKQTSSITYSQNGSVQSLHVIDVSVQSLVGNWKYTAENESSGVLEEFKDGKLVEKGNVKFLGKSQLQYTITFSANSDIVGRTYIWNKE